MSAQKVINCCKKQNSRRIIWGGANPNTGFDCSGLVVYCFKQGAGISLPHFTGDLIKKGTPVKKKDLKPGDLIFPNDHHVGIYIGNGEFIHAPQTGDVVKISKVAKFYTARRLL